MSKHTNHNLTAALRQMPAAVRNVEQQRNSLPPDVSGSDSLLTAFQLLTQAHVRLRRADQIIAEITQEVPYNV